MCKTVIGPQGVGDFMEMLESDSKAKRVIKHILLGNNVAGDKLPESISELLARDKSNSITTLYLAGNDITQIGISKLCSVLKNDSKILQLWLKRNPLNPEGIYYVSEYLKVNKFIQTLDLSNTAVFDQGLNFIADSLILNNSLKHIYLSGNAIS